MMCAFPSRRLRSCTQNCAQAYQLQPLLAGGLFCWSVPPAPEVSPLHPLLEPPAPGFSPLQALAASEQPLMANVDPAIRLATQKPAKIFFRSLTSINTSLKVRGEVHIFPLGRELRKRIIEMRCRQKLLRNPIHSLCSM